MKKPTTKPVPSTERYRRVNILITEEQHEKISHLDLTLSGLVRDLLDDRLSESTITLALTPQTKQHYDYIVSHFGVSDREIEPFFAEALDRFLESKVQEIEGLRQKIKRRKSS